MVEFMSGYRPPMEREFEPVQPLGKDTTIEDPIIPIGQIGTTVIDAGGGNILSNLDKSIRLGTKKIQLVLFGGQNGSPSSTVSSYGSTVRKEIKEKAKASGVDIVGLELAPQRIQGMSGYNPQGGGISEEQRQNDIRHVKDSLKFALDVGARSVDVLSNEFQRNIVDAKWNTGKYRFFDNKQDELTPEGLEKAQLTKYLVDSRTGQIQRDSVVRTNDHIHRVQYRKAEDENRVGKKDRNGRVLQKGDFIDIEGNYVDFYSDSAYEKLVPKFDDKTKKYEMETLTWNQLAKEADDYNKHRGLKGKEALSTEEYIFEQKMATQKALMRGQSLYYGHNLDLQLGQIKELVELRRFAERIEKDMTKEQREQWITDNALGLVGSGRRGTELPDDTRRKLLSKMPSEVIQEAITRQYSAVQGSQEMVRNYSANEAEIDEIKKNVILPEKYAKEKTFDSYAEAGLQAWRLSKDNKLGDKPLYVGPEIGWAGQSYGGHPEEFKEVILESRKRLAEKLEKEGMSADAAKAQAKQHIKGMLDTSHMSMWFKHFAKESPNESDEKHLKRFNGWLKEQAESLVKAGVVGGVQVVDSVTADHAHLPAGQGVFDMVGLVKTMKNAGYEGPLISEGHEEDQFTNGRILTATWEAFGSPITGVSPGQRAGLSTWGGMHHAYFGSQMPHAHIIGGYAPSNDWTLWSDTPFE